MRIDNTKEIVTNKERREIIILRNRNKQRERHQVRSYIQCISNFTLCVCVVLTSFVWLSSSFRTVSRATNRPWHA